MIVLPFRIKEVVRLSPIKFLPFRLVFAVFLSMALLCLFFGTGKLLAKESPPGCFDISWPSELSLLEPDPSLVRGKLKNGFRYVIKKNQKPKNRAAVYLNVQAGSLHEDDGQQGLAHFLEHMLFKGSTHFPAGSLVNYFQSMGMDFGRDTNAHTSHDATIYNIILPEGTEVTLDSAFLVMADYARGALLLESEIKSERGVILAEKRARDSAEYRNHVARSSFAFRGTKYPERRPIGTEETIEHADRDQLKSYYDAWYRPENMILVVVGDIKPQVAVELIEKHFTGLTSSGPLPKCPDFGKLILTGADYFYHHEPELGKTIIAIQNFWDMPVENDSLTLEKTALLRILGSMAVNHRIERLLEEAKVPFAEAGYGSGDIVNRIGYASISAQVEGERWQQSLSSLEQILRQAILHGFSQTEVERVRKQLLAQLDTRVLTKNTDDSRSIARRIINHLNSNRVYQDAVQEKALYGPLIEELTVAEVNQNFRKSWEGNASLISVTGDIELGENASTAIAATYQKSRSESISVAEDRKTHTFPYLEFPVDKTPPQRTYFPDVEVERLAFANGLVVNLKMTDFEENRIRIRADFGAGRQHQAIPGMALLGEEVINGSGTAQLPQSAIDEILAGSSVAMSFRVNESSFAWIGATLPSDFELFCQLLQSRLADQGFRHNIFSSVKTNIELMYRELEREIEGAIPLVVQPFLAHNHERFGLPAWEVVDKIDYETLAEWAQSFAKSKDLEISVVGDFTRDSIVPVLTKYFSGSDLLSPSDLKVDTVRFPKGKNLNVAVNTSVDKSLVTIAWPIEDSWDIHRTRRLQLLTRIFGDRLREVIREELAASYAPSVSSFNSRVYQGYGYIISQIVIKPGMEDMVIGEIFEISEQLQKDGVSPEELTRAQQPLLTSMKESLQNNRYWLHSVLSRSIRYPQQLDWPATLIHDYMSVGADELNQLAARYLINEKAAVARIYPQKEPKGPDVTFID